MKASLIQHSQALLFLLTFTGTLLAHTSLSRADGSLVTDISSHLISVTSDFTGTDLLLFGTVRGDIASDGQEHGDIIVVIRGPETEVIVRKKERIAGIWANTDALEIDKVPGFYASASNRPVREITSGNTLDRLRIGPERIAFRELESRSDAVDFKRAIVRQRQAEQLYTDGQSKVYFLGPSLFRTTIHFPANVPVGTYTAEFYLFKNGDLISAQSSPLFIKKSGLGRQIYDFAQNHPAWHGLAAIIIALIAGWVASAIFRKE
ncbi:TIGR02186 family protein [Sneathiella chinensis]|uniref:TIGR02186 family protein n=1 Tax=Sneathiella chinensis TaxID=349750 RepID=A0ABQ5TZQ8_9PROT|nr:TIGR02186 family protein [Sneathiella chinensis]GLQ05477.1 hypothetical protein GCM10007924_06980 [Sneathiella chinensis]